MADDDLTRSSLSDQIAGRLRNEIARGKYAPGDPLPSEAELVTHYGVGRDTARRAIGVLRDEGLVEVRQGRTAHVRVPPLQLPISRYSRRERLAGLGPFEATCRRAGVEGYGEVVMVEQRTADELTSRRLEIPAGGPYIYRRRYMHAGDDPMHSIVQIQEGHLPLAIVGGTDLANLEKIEEGTYAALDAIGHGPASYTEQVSSRFLTREESLIFNPRSNTPATTIMRTTRDRDGTVVEVLYVTALGDQQVFLYEDLPVE